MLKNLFICSVLLLLVACSSNDKTSEPSSSDFTSRYITETLDSSLIMGKTYLPVYSQIYMQTDKAMHSLTVSTSIRNISTDSPIYIETAEFYNTKGELIKNYLKKPIQLAPLETVEIVIHENDNSGGTGGNFIFDWSIPKSSEKPLFQAVMISTTSQQGLSFSTNGIEISRK